MAGNNQFSSLTAVRVCLWSSCYWPPVCVRVWGHLVTDPLCVILLVVILVLTSCVYDCGHLVPLFVHSLHLFVLSDLRSLSLAPEPRCSFHPAVSLETVSGFAASDPEKETGRGREREKWCIAWDSVIVCVCLGCVCTCCRAIICVCVCISFWRSSICCMCLWVTCLTHSVCCWVSSPFCLSTHTHTHTHTHKR